MPHWKTLHPASEFFGAHCIYGLGDVKTVIDHVKQGAVPVAGSSKKEKKPVAMIRSKAGLVPWVLCKTVCKTLEALTGTPDTDRWKNVAVTLYVTQTRGPAGNTVDCVRVRPTAPKSGAAPLDATERPVDIEMVREPGEDAAPLDETVPT